MGRVKLHETTDIRLAAGCDVCVSSREALEQTQNQHGGKNSMHDNKLSQGGIADGSGSRIHITSESGQSSSGAVALARVLHEQAWSTLLTVTVGGTWERSKVRQIRTHHRLTFNVFQYRQ